MGGFLIRRGPDETVDVRDLVVKGEARIGRRRYLFRRGQVTGRCQKVGGDCDQCDGEGERAR